MAAMELQQTHTLVCINQAQSPLFKIPAEIRNMIYKMVLSEYDHTDATKQFANNNYFKRPGCNALQKIETTLLQTCQRIYHEAKELPWNLKQHSIYLACAEYKPAAYREAPATLKPSQMQQLLVKVRKTYGEDALKISNIAIFAQVAYLEDNTSIQKYLSLNHFYPARITLTIRHIDWKNWRDDEPFSINASFPNDCRFPNSVQEIYLRLETIHHKVAQLKHFAKLVKSSWAFKRRDGAILISPKEAQDTTTEWMGSSILGNDRWFRDEFKHGKMLYHIHTMKFVVDTKDIFAQYYEAPDINMTSQGYVAKEHEYPCMDMEEVVHRRIDFQESLNYIQSALARYPTRCACQEREAIRLREGCCLVSDSEIMGAGWQDSMQSETHGLCVQCQVSGCRRKRRLEIWERIDGFSSDESEDSDDGDEDFGRVFEGDDMPSFSWYDNGEDNVGDTEAD